MAKIPREADQSSGSEVAKKHEISDVAIFLTQALRGSWSSSMCSGCVNKENAKLNKLAAGRDLEIDVMKEAARK